MYLRLFIALNDHVGLHKFSALLTVRCLSDMPKFRSDLAAANDIVILTGAGISAESGIPTFRGGNHKWGKYHTAFLATPEAFKENPSLVWEYYQFRRARTLVAEPNPAHIAIAKYQERHTDKIITVITQNVDNLHIKSGTKNVIELHGNLFKTRCTKCKKVAKNFDNPICPALQNRGSPGSSPNIPVEELPRCKLADCNGLLRPHVLWFGEKIRPVVLERSEKAIAKCGMCLVIGTSSVVYPAARFAPAAASHGAIVAEFNIEDSPTREDFKYYFQGQCGVTIPEALQE